MPELLSICIPTFNRSAYLNDLLEHLVPELEATPGAADLVRFYISDNASTDDTRELVSRFSLRWPIVYNCNPVNIGADRNFAQMIDKAPGTYFWLLGDDELLVRGFLAHLLEVLKPATHDLVLLGTVSQEGTPSTFVQMEKPATFPNYAAFLDYYRKTNPWEIMAHSFISSMMIKRSIFDLKKTREILGTVDRCYAHMYGLVDGLARDPGSIYLDNQASVIIRTRRATIYDVSTLEINYLWRRYYRWLGLKFGHPDLVEYGRTLFGPRKWWRMKRQHLKAALGLNPKKKA